MGIFDFFSSKKKEKVGEGLKETRKSFISSISKSIIGKDVIDEDVLDSVEEQLIAADIGVETTVKVINKLEECVKKEKYTNIKELNSLLKSTISDVMEKEDTNVTLVPETGQYPYVVLVVGVNGVGKTTTIGKLANFFKSHQKRVILGAADTFRAAAVDQIKLWGNKIDVPVISHGMNTDPSSVAYDAVKTAVNENYDVVLIDTAGRLHNKVGLMNELGKIKRVIQKFIPEAPHDVMLVLDGNTGQNAFVQVKEFKQVTDVTCLTITKLDGTAKGGVIIGIISEFGVPVKYVGLGEKADDLQPFDRNDFIDSLFCD